MKTCSDCNREIPRGIVCESCSAVLEVMLVVKRHWGLDELEKLRDMLRNEGVRDALHAANSNGSHLKAKLLAAIIDAGARIGCGPDIMRSKVCDGINAELRAAKQADAYDAKHGDGSYTRHCARWLGENVGQALSAVHVPRETEVSS